MVVVAIIGILSNIALVQVGDVIHRARDKTRLGNLATLQSVISAYYTDHFYYPYDPNNPTSTSGPLLCEEASADNAWPEPVLPNNFVPNVTPQYIVNLPHDPGPGGLADDPYVPACATNGYSHTMVYCSTGTDYKLIYHCSAEATDITPNSPFYDPVRCSGSAPTDYCWAWAIYSPGLEGL